MGIDSGLEFMNPFALSLVVGRGAVSGGFDRPVLSIVEGLSPDGTKTIAGIACAQWIAAYMIFSSVASSAEYSSTTLPMRCTRMRSDSAMTSGR